LMDTVLSGARQDFPDIWIKKILELSVKRRSSETELIPITPKTLMPSPVNTTLINSNIQVLTIPSQYNIAGNQIIIVNAVGSDNLVNTPSTSCAKEVSDVNQFTPFAKPILCVDGNNATPTSTSDTDTPDPPQGSNSTTIVSTGNFVNNDQSTDVSNSPVPRSPLKRVSLGSQQFHKSPLKAASDRILKKYSSPIKRSVFFSQSPKRGLRELRKKPLVGSPSQSLTPSRRFVPLAPKRADTPPCVDVSLTGLSPRSPCMPSPCLEEADGGAEVDTPTILARRKTRHQKETELTLSLVSQLETPEEKEAREARESQEMFQEINKVLADNPEQQAAFVKIMEQASTAGTVQTYQALASLLAGQSLVQEMLLDLLSPSQAAELGQEVYWQHHQRQNMKNFILKLGVAYRHQPAYHARVLRELDALCADSSLTPDILKGVAVKLFKHNQHLLDHFLMLVPGVEPPEAMLPSPEILQYPEDSDNSWGSEEAMETVTVQRSPESQNRV